MNRLCLLSLVFLLLTTTSQASVTTKPEAWRADLRYLAGELPRRST